MVAHFPARRAVLRVGRLVIPLRVIGITIFARIHPTSPISDVLVKAAGLLAQFIAAVILISENTSPHIYIPLGVAVFAFGFFEGGIGVWREW